MFILLKRFILKTFLQVNMWFLIYYMYFSLVQCVAKCFSCILILQNVIVIVSSSSKPIYLYNEFLSYDSVLQVTTVPLLQRFGERCSCGRGGIIEGIRKPTLLKPHEDRNLNQAEYVLPALFIAIFHDTRKKKCLIFRFSQTVLLKLFC